MRTSAVLALVAALGLIASLALRRTPELSPPAPVERIAEPAPPVEERLPDPRPEPAVPTPQTAEAPPEPEETVLRCRVADAQTGKPLSGLQFWVAANASGKLEASGEVRSDDGGTFEFRAPGGRITEFALSMKSSGYRIRGPNNVAVRPGSGSVTATIVVATQELVRIIVKAEGAGPIPNARVDWWRGSRRALERSGGVTDIEGAFPLPVDFGGSTISAIAPGYGRGFLDVPAPVSMELKLKAVPPVHGLLFDSEGGALAGARLDIMLPPNPETEARRELTEEVATTELDGTFVLKSITPNTRYYVRVTSSLGTSLDLEDRFFLGHAAATLLLRLRKLK